MMIDEPFIQESLFAVLENCDLEVLKWETTTKERLPDISIHFKFNYLPGDTYCTVELSFILSLLSDVTGFRKLYNPVEHYKRLLYSYVLQVFFYCEVFKFTVNRRQTEVFRSFEYRETRKHYFAKY